VAVPFLSKASFLDAVKSDPQILLVLAMGMVFIAYGLGGPRLLATLRVPFAIEQARDRGHGHVTADAV